ncbi:hypothetical protein [Xanthomonas graminis]|uniref:hypothetical protein n=1 Tax=Xanthomonas graminis TaxID=3390026 RepID=UPI001112E0B7|nr:hypothetical protein [Xanthomonas translucens]
MPTSVGAAVAIAAGRAAAPGMTSRVALAEASLTYDRTPHLFWVYRLLRFEHVRGAYADADLPGLAQVNPLRCAAAQQPCQQAARVRAEARVVGGARARQDRAGSGRPVAVSRARWRRPAADLACAVPCCMRNIGCMCADGPMTRECLRCEASAFGGWRRASCR